MLLSELLKEISPEAVVGEYDGGLDVRGIAYDSRKVEPDFLFVAIPGSRVDGHNYIAQAVELGAKVIFCEREVEVAEGIVVVRVPDCRLALAALSAAFYGHPDRKMRLIGVTGTNGKTTVTNLIKWLLDSKGYKTGLIGTICNMAGVKKLPADHTTPESLELFRLLKDMEDEGCQYVAMEVSSHALSQGRVSACDYAAAVFTNLTQDHLDFHGSMAAYLQSKLKLFRMLDPAPGEKRYGVVNINDKSGSSFSEHCKAPVITYGSDEDGITLRLLYYTPSGRGTKFALTYDGQLYRAEMPLIGKFNVYNALAAMAVALQEGMSMEECIEALAKAPQVPGRFELVDEGQNFDVIVDYAHTPDGLKNLLSAARKLKPRRLITVFGCGGNRDKGKRSIMGHIAGSFSDVVILTNDNPRYEKPEDIVAQIELGLMEVDNNYLVELDRDRAIALAINMAESGDMVVIAGKGHENEQIIGNCIIQMDDREFARESLRKKLQK
ncbi:MAG: UDP-N-acetylmuramoyl-L-alanyl-D-glutamate--2,6-diaminopimelate ligase [Bacillota bacterium]|nr:UDP-N-acetylmuramoyl-L-alanyl-D-glutamate--2,6-diaminopimelate ligase [Bacillota bacterium]